MICSSKDDCLYLGPQHGNIHCIQALEDGATFFDLLIPGYGGRPCHYYQPQVSEPPVASTCVLLKEIPVPNTYRCHDVFFEDLLSKKTRNSI